MATVGLTKRNSSSTRESQRQAFGSALGRAMAAVLILLTLLIGMGTNMGSTPQASAEEPDPTSFTGYLDGYGYDYESKFPPLSFAQQLIRHIQEYGSCYARDGKECWHLKSTKEWAESTTEWKYPGGNVTDGTVQNAFKHCIWTGALATRLGETASYRVGFVHEKTARQQPEEFRQMDEWNNFVGAKIGSDAKRNNLPDQWGYVMDKCYSLAESNQLYGPGGVKGKYAGR